MPRALVWFRRNLRLDDNAALSEALHAADAVVPVFVLEDHYLTEDYSPPRLKVLAESVRELAAALERKGSRLLVRKGPPEEAIPALAREVGADAVFAHRDHEPYPRTRDARTARALAAMGARLSLVEDLHLVPPSEVRTNEGRPYGVYGAFARRWREAVKGEPLPEPRKVPTPATILAPGFPSILLERPRGFREAGAPENPHGGAAEARRLWDAFRRRALPAYAERRDLPAEQGTSRLSPHLRFGTIGVRRILAEAREAWREADAAGRRSIDVFVGELAWREFYAAILEAEPRVATESWRREFDRFPWAAGAEADRRFEAWCAGRTGYPLVDAGMRQLAREGWMHNRVRMVVASFLTKHLLIDWRSGEAFFRRHLADADLASNNGGWQWSAGCGTDAQPFFRIFNPVLQGERFDPEGAYVRRYVPELAGFSGGPIHAPWRAARPPAGYPPPIVEHAAARAAALAAWETVRAEGPTARRKG